MEVIFTFTIFSLIALSYEIKITLLPIFGYSHHKAAAVLGQELSKRGHAVTSIQLISTDTWENITTYTVSSKLDHGFYEKYKIKPGLGTMKKSPFVNIDLLTTCKEMLQFCYDIIEDSKAMQILNETDLVIGEVGLKHAIYIAEYFKKPLIGYHHLVTKIINQLFRIPASEIYVPVFNSWYTDTMSVSQKLFQYFCSHILAAGLISLYDRHFKPIRDKLGIDDSIDQKYNYSLILLQYDPLLEYPQPIPSNAFKVGPWTNEPGKNLPKLFEDFINSSDRGFVLVSFGTVFTISSDDSEKSNSLLYTLSKLEYQVILSVKGHLANNLPYPNVLFVNFVPQNDLLAHSKIALFVTHAGILSVREACYHGVPVFVVPRGFDQHENGFHLTERLKMGVMVEFNPLKYYTWLKIIPEIIQNRSYRENAMRSSKVLKSRPHTYAREKAADIIEEFIRWDFDASHLRPRVLDMPWYEYYVLDVLFTVFVVPTFLIFILRKCCKLYYVDK